MKHFQQIKNRTWIFCICLLKTCFQSNQIMQNKGLWEQ
jgi:hypothetical protein